MKLIQRREVPATTKTVITGIKCDLCKKEYSNLNWGRRAWEVQETVVKWRTGCSFHDGGSGEEAKIDLCPECFEKKLIPWFESQGVIINREDWDY